MTVRRPAARVPRSLRPALPRALARPAASVLSAAIAATIGGAAQAQDAADSSNDAEKSATEKNTQTMDTIVVEARMPAANPHADPQAPYKVDRLQSSKFTRPILDLSKSITAIPRQVIRDSGATSLRDIMRTLPGVTIGTGEGGNAFGDRFIIRGFEARSDVFVDGVRDPGVIAREIFALEQVEIARGPSSTFAGRGTTGAAVNLVSKAPAADSFREIEAGIGTDSYQRVTFDLNQAVNEAVALRINGLWHDAGVAGRDEVHDERAGIAVAVGVRPWETAGFTFDYYYLDVDALPDWGIPYDLANNRPFDVDRSSFYGLTTRDFWDVQSEVATLKFDWAINDALRLENLTRYGDTGNAYVASAPEAPNAAARSVQARAKTRNQTNEYFGNQTNLVAHFATGSVRHEMVAGAEFSNEDMDNTPFVVVPSAVTQPLDDPDPRNWSGTITRSPSTAVRDVDTWSLYVLDTLLFGERWEVFGGLRRDDWSIDALTIVNEYVNEASRLANDSDFANWHTGLVYKPVPNASVYAALSSSSNPSGELVDGGGADYGSITPQNQNLDPERNRNYELGTKWAVADGHLLLTAALFRTEKTNARVTTGAGSAAVTNLEGEQRVDGVELGLAGDLGERLSLFGGYTWLDTEIVSSPDPNQVGKSLPNVAERSFSLQGRYQWTDAFALGGTVSYASEINGGTTYATTTGIPDWWRGDLFAEYRFTAGLGARLNLLNVTDETYYETLYRSATPFVYVAPGRSAQLTFEYEF